MKSYPDNKLFIAISPERKSFFVRTKKVFCPNDIFFVRTKNLFCSDEQLFIELLERERERERERVGVVVDKYCTHIPFIFFLTDQFNTIMQMNTKIHDHDLYVYMHEILCIATHRLMWAPHTPMLYSFMIRLLSCHCETWSGVGLIQQYYVFQYFTKPYVCEIQPNVIQAYIYISLSLSLSLSLAATDI